MHGTLTNVNPKVACENIRKDNDFNEDRYIVDSKKINVEVSNDIKEDTRDIGKVLIEMSLKKLV